MPVVAVVGAKGGTGKTASVAALGQIFAATGHDVLLIDFDPQGTLTRRHGLPRSSSPLFEKPVPLELPGMEPESGRLTILPGGRALEAACEDEIAAHLASVVNGVEIVLIDTVPTLGPSSRMALRAADLVVVLCTPGPEAIDGYTDVCEVAASVRPDLQVRAVFTLAHTRSRVLKWSQEQMSQRFPGACYPDVVPFEVAAAESAVHLLPVTLSAPGSRSACAYRELSARILEDLRPSGRQPGVS